MYHVSLRPDASWQEDLLSIPAQRASCPGVFFCPGGTPSVKTLWIKGGREWKENIGCLVKKHSHRDWWTTTALWCSVFGGKRVGFTPDCFTTSSIHIQYIHPSIHPFPIAVYPTFTVVGVAGVYPSWPSVKAGCTLNMWPPVHDRATTIDTLFRVNLEPPVNPVLRSMDCGRKPEFLERSHTGTLPVGIEPTTSLTRHLFWATSLSTLIQIFTIPF